MPATAKRLRPDDLQILQQFRQKRLRAFIRDFLSLAVYLSIVLLSQVGLVFYNGASPHRVGFNLYFAYIVGGFIGLYLALAPLCSLFIRLFRVHALPRVLRWQDMLFLNLSLLVSVPAVLLMIAIWKPFRFIHVGSFGDITATCFCIATLTCILLFLTRQLWPFPHFSQIIRQIIIGILLAAFLFFVLVMLISFTGFSFHFNNIQLWQCSILLVMLWPIFLLHESVVHNWAERGTLSAFLLSLSFRVCFLGVIYILIMLSPEKKFIELVWPIPVIVFLFLQYCCSILYRKGRATIAGSTLTACIMAWTLTSHLMPVNL